MKYSNLSDYELNCEFVKVNFYTRDCEILGALSYDDEYTLNYNISEKNNHTIKTFGRKVYFVDWLDYYLGVITFKDDKDNTLEYFNLFTKDKGLVLQLISECEINVNFKDHKVTCSKGDISYTDDNLVRAFLVVYLNIENN